LQGRKRRCFDDRWSHGGREIPRGFLPRPM
jgi:hypothetical protein